MAKGAAGKRCRWEGCAQATGANAIRPFGEWPDACAAASLGDEASIQLSRPMALASALLLELSLRIALTIWNFTVRWSIDRIRPISP